MTPEDGHGLALGRTAASAEGEGHGGLGGDAAARPKKAPTAFRTISEVADELHIPQHVLRFWETKFPQVKPLKRGGGRRYYRPDDIALLRRISDLLYIQGYTIKGVQRLLREGGGKLSDDIPPPPASERAEGGEGGTNLELPGLVRPSLGSAAERERTPRARPEARPSGEAGGAAGDRAELERLRAVLRHTLHELEALRALLP
jgi:DNA-binding transcriptional MerR regulator